MSYIVGLTCAVAAVLAAIGGVHRRQPSSVGAVGVALVASVSVFYTTIGNPGLDWIRSLDCFEIALAALLPVAAVASRGARRGSRALVLVPVVPLLVVLALSLTDAFGITRQITGWLPGIGLAVAPGILSSRSIYFGAAAYCSTPVIPGVLMATAASTAWLFGVGLAGRDRRRVAAAFAAVCLFAATFLTRDVRPCVPRRGALSLLDGAGGPIG